jgi:hypothetical protein
MRVRDLIHAAAKYPPALPHEATSLKDKVA